MEEIYTCSLARTYNEYLSMLLRREIANYPANHLLSSHPKWSSVNMNILVTSCPSFSLSSFVMNLFNQMNCSLEVYIISLVYLKRVLAVFPGLFCAETAHNLTLTSIMLAHKFFDESCYRSDFYAYLASLPIPQLNALEAWFLQTLDYALFVSDEDYFAQYTELTEVVTPRLASEGVFLPPLIRSPCGEGPLSCLKYQSTSYSSLLEVQHQQWKQRCSILPVPPIVAVPVTVTVPTIPCLTTLPSFQPIHPSAPTSFASYPNALQSSSILSSSASSISSTSSYSQSVESAHLCGLPIHRLLLRSLSYPIHHHVSLLPSCLGSYILMMVDIPL